jgi:hypothetical protein
MIVLKPGLGDTTKDLLQMAMEIQSVIGQGASFTEMASVYSVGSEGKSGGDWGWVEETTLRKGLGEVAFSLDPGSLSGALGLAPDGSGHYWIYRYDDKGQILSARQYTDRDIFVVEKTGPALAEHRDLLPDPQEYYLMQVEAKRVARTKSLEEVRDEIENDLKVEERARLQKKWVDRLKEKSFVRYF